jgi:hypothetical protein
LELRYLKDVDIQINTLIEKAVTRKIKYDKKIIDDIEFVDVGIGGGTLELFANVFLKDNYLWRGTAFVLSSYTVPRGKGPDYMFQASNDDLKVLQSEKVTSIAVGVDDYIRRMNLLLAKIAKEAKKSD